MALMNTGSVAAYAWNVVQDVPADISGTVMQQYAEMAVYRVANWTGDSLGTTNIGTKYQPILVDMTALVTLGRMTGVGVDNSYKLGDLSVNKGTANQTQIGQMQSLSDSIQAEKRGLGRKARFGATFIS